MAKSIEDIKINYYGYYREKLTVGEMINFLQQLPRDMKTNRTNMQLAPYDSLDWFEDEEDPKTEYNSLNNWYVDIWSE